MTRWHHAAVLFCVGLMLVLTTGACGSGSTTTTPTGTTTTPTDPLALFSGTYCLAGFSGRAGAPDEGSTSWGDIVSDGAGMVVGGMTSNNENGVISGPNPIVPPNLPYAVNPGGYLELTLAFLPFLWGGISSTGAVAAVMQLSQNPGIFILGKKSGSYTNASLNGAYFLCAFMYDQGALEDRTRWGTATFDGAGGGNTNVSSNNQGVIGGPVGAALNYNVAADGTVTGDLLGFALTGAILDGGELIVLGGATAAGVPILMLLVQSGAGLSNASLTGTYHVTAIEAENAPPPDTWLSFITTFAADGAGTFTVGAFTSNSDGSLTTFPPVGSTLDYAVAGNGLLNVNVGEMFGGVSPSGRYAIFAGGAGAGDDPQFFFLFK